MNWNCEQVLSWCKSFITDPSVLACIEENEIDGATLTLMDTVEKIAAVIPKLKHQLIFLKERGVWMAANTDISKDSIDSSSSSLIVSPDAPSSVPSVSDGHTTLEQSGNEEPPSDHFPERYTIPPLPSSILKDIDDGSMHKFGPHCSNRQVLIETVAHDLIDKHQLFYPSRREFDTIGLAIVSLLKLPPVKENVTIWKDALQTKLKRKRHEHPDNLDVQHHQAKYSRIGSGRAGKRRIGEVAQRDRQKQTLLATYDDAVLLEMKRKAAKLQDFSQIDIVQHMGLWRDTLHIRRQYIRENSTSDTITSFPGYSSPLLIFEEVKMLTRVDLGVVVRHHVPVLLDKVTSTAIFVTDSPPVRLLKVLCHSFNETFQHMFTSTEPSTPYPTMVFADNAISIYVDFLPITLTTSPEEALALMISMYTIFELNFPKNNRTMRLLYAVLHADTRFLSNTIRHFIKEKKIDILDVHRQSDASTSFEGNDDSQISQRSTSAEKPNRSSELVLSPVTISKVTHHPPMQSSPIEHQSDGSDNENNDENGNSQPQKPTKKCARDDRRARQPLANRTNMSRKRRLPSSAEHQTEEQGESVRTTSGAKPKRRRR